MFSSIADALERRWRSRWLGAQARCRTVDAGRDGRAAGSVRRLALAVSEDDGFALFPQLQSGDHDAVCLGDDGGSEGGVHIAVWIEHVLDQPSRSEHLPVIGDALSRPHQAVCGA